MSDDEVLFGDGAHSAPVAKAQSMQLQRIKECFYNFKQKMIDGGVASEQAEYQEES